MGKKDDWCSSKGLNNRKKGMYEKESKGRKICLCTFFGFAAFFFLAVGSLYASRASNAGKINDDYDETKLKAEANKSDSSLKLSDPARFCSTNSFDLRALNDFKDLSKQFEDLEKDIKALDEANVDRSIEMPYDSC